MKKLSELQDFFYDKIFPDLQYLEDKRLQIYGYLKKVAFGLLALTCIIIFLFPQIVFISIETLVPTLAAPIAIFGFIYKIEVSGFASLYKDALIEKIVSFIDPLLRYEKNSSLGRHEYESSTLFPSQIDKFYGDDLVSGVVDGVSIRFSELHTQVKKKTSKGHTYWANVFRGLLLIADFNKNFQGKTVVLPDNAEKIIGPFSRFFQSFSSHGELIKLDSPEFERAFVVYSSDQIEARYILSHSLMQNILEYQKLLGKNISLSFVGSKIYIAVAFNEKLFEPKVYKSVQSFDTVKFYFQILSLAIEMVDILKLERKIWSKR